MVPLACPTLAPRGQTPRLFYGAGHRQKVSVAAAVLLSPARRHLRLYWESFPDGTVDHDAYAAFLTDLRHEIRGPLIVLQDQAPFHRGDAVEEAVVELPNLIVEEFPPYAPELNPPEFLWRQIKAADLANFVPHDVPELTHAVHRKLWAIAQDQARLRSFLNSSELTW